MHSFDRPIRVLCLDGGGAKGMYTLGILSELEQRLKEPIHKHFDFIYGTSTGAIIASSLAFGKSVDETINTYRHNIPNIMTRWSRKKRAAELETSLRATFGNAKFDEFETNVGIVATNYTRQEAMIFKNTAASAHARRASFEPGFGCTIVDAVTASCSALPFFPSKMIYPANQAPAELIDGGFVANDPSLIAFVDMRAALNLESEQIKILSLGTGSYPEQLPIRAKWQLAHYAAARQFIQRQFEISSNNVQRIAKLLIPKQSRLRISDTFREPQYGTSLFESDPAKLDTLLGLGRISFGEHEDEIVAFLNAGTSRSAQVDSCA